jgi:SAM-dependent methyltransferase
VTDWLQVTETPGLGATPEQLSMIATRYRLVAEHARGKELLELACGPAIAFGYLGRTARRVVGGDIEPRNIEQARRTYAGDPRFEFHVLDAQQLPFPDDSFDVAVLLDSIYWIPDQAAFVREAHRVLRPGGTLIVTTVNRRWREFNPHPFASRYLDAPELLDLVEAGGFAPELRVGFPTGHAGRLDDLIGLVRRTAVRFHLIPSSVRAKELLKRLFYGRLRPIPLRIDESLAPAAPLRPAARDERLDGYKLLYVVARSRKAAR